MAEIDVRKVVVHELIKEQRKDPKPTNYRDNVLDPTNDIVKKLVLGVMKVYGSRRNSAHYGVFRSGEGRGAFPPHFHRYGGLDDVTDKQFMKLSREAMECLYSKAEITPLATGGYILFADFYYLETRYFLMAMIKQKPGMRLNKKLEPEELEQLDLERLYQAARINFTKYDEYTAATDEERSDLSYLSFLSPSSDRAASGYFVMALGCSKGSTSNKATSTLIKETRNFFKSNQHLKSQHDAFRKDLMEYLETKIASGESVKLSEVGHIVQRNIPAELADDSDDLVDDILTKLNGEGCAVPAEFPVSRKAVNRYTHITGKADAWKVEFNRGALGVNDDAPVYYNRKAQTLTMKGIPEEMKADIEAELSQRKPD